MKPVILCCFANLNPETELLVRAHAPGARFIDTSSDDMAYCRALRFYWDCGADLITIEQDMEITPDCVPSFNRCDRSWCTFSYQGPAPLGYLYHGLGCTRFSAELQSAVSFSEFIPNGDVQWFHLDKVMSRVLMEHTIPHVHGHLQHHHDYGSMGMRYADEMQPDGSSWLYEINPDGSRGRLVCIATDRVY